MKKIKVDINDLSKSRDKEKTARLVEFYIKTTPPAKDILSGKAFRELLR